jgi:hypothetical protein
MAGEALQPRRGRRSGHDEEVLRGGEFCVEVVHWGPLGDTRRVTEPEARCARNLRP